MEDLSTDTVIKQLIEDISNAPSIESLEKIQTSFFGRNGTFNKWAGQMKSITDKEKKSHLGKTLNAAKHAIEEALSKKKSTFTGVASVGSMEDRTLPGVKPHVGHLHPTTIVVRKINDFFRYYGYSVYEGPEIETNEYNFEKLNIPQDHPARGLMDTLYIHEPDVLLRTHTSSVETRALSKEELPLRIVVPGKVYRNENTNMTNSAMFYQYEGLHVDKGITLADLKGTLNAFVKFLYGNDIKTRFRCKYYPQVEPGAGLDIRCTFCKGKGCGVCKYRGWIEVLGSGMVHPNMLEKCGINSKEWSGFAFGMGLDRLVMTQYGINDIRKLYSGELVYGDEL